MGISIGRERVIEEVQLIPEEKLTELFDFLHYFRLGLQKSKGSSAEIMKFAGCWKEMPEELFQEFTEEIMQRRKNAFTGRRASETSTD
jgi:hypothetical protein